MRYRRAHILLPEDLAREIDAVVGRRGRSAFLVETAREALRRRRLLAFLKDDKAVWRDSDHPELRGGFTTDLHRRHVARLPLVTPSTNHEQKRAP